MTGKTIVKLIAVILSLLFIYAALGKLGQYTIFRLQFQKYPLSIPVIKQQPWLVPLIELVIAGLLLFSARRLQGLFGALFLLGLYTLYLTYLLNNRYAQSCHCGEPWPLLSLKSNIIFNLAAVFVAGTGIVLYGRCMEPDA